ncbi:L-2-hydroxyglutarate oxidase LhgO [Arthrobacter sp. UYEF6]
MKAVVIGAGIMGPFVARQLGLAPQIIITSARAPAGPRP